MLNIIKSKEGTSLNVALEGRLDTTTAPELEAELKASLDGVSELTMDFAKLDYHDMLFDLVNRERAVLRVNPCEIEADIARKFADG